MPPKKGPRKSMPGRINKTPTLTPSRRSARVPPSQKDSNETSRPPKTLNITSASPQENPINIRFYNPKTAPSSPCSQEKPPETPSSRRRTFQSRPSRLSTVYTPTVDTPATNQGSRRTRRTAALETPKEENSEASDLELPDSVESGGWTFDQYIGSFKTKTPTEGPSSPTSASDMRNSSRIRKPTKRAVESLETSRKKTRRQTTLGSSPTVENPSPVGVQDAKPKVSKKPIKKTRTSKRVANSSMKRDDTLPVRNFDANAVAKLLFDLTMEALSPAFTLPPNYPDFFYKLRDDYYKRRRQEGYDLDSLADQSTSSNDAEVADDASAGPGITLTSPAPLPANIIEAGVLSQKKISEIKTNSDGWVETGRGEEFTIISDNYHPHFAANSYGYERLPWPPVLARSSQQAEIEYSHGFPPLMGNRNLPVEGPTPFTTENVQEEQARVLANAPAPAPAPKNKKLRARKRRQTEPTPANINGEEAVSAPAPAPAQTTAPTGGRKSQRRRRQTAPGPSAPSSSPSTPPTTATQGRLGRAGAAVSPATEGDKPKVQRLRLTLKPASGPASVSTEASAAQSPSSPALLGAPSPALPDKRRRRRG
ncbi:unnamed protein product [Penicillium bialowiezense]